MFTLPSKRNSVHLFMNNTLYKDVTDYIVKCEKQIADLQEKLSLAHTEIARLDRVAIDYANKVTMAIDKLHRRNMQIDYLKKRIAKKKILEAKTKDEIKSCYAINKKGESYLPTEKMDDHKYCMDKSHRLICEQNELLMALLVAEGKMDVEDALNQ
jgi:hypothetical protein